MKKGMLFMALVALLVIPVVSYAETGQECASDCVNKCAPLGSGKEYATCLENCLKGCYDKPTGIPDVPPPTPANPPKTKSENNSSKPSAEAGTEKESMITNIVVASVFDDLDQPCYVGGKVAAYCSRNHPYYNAFNGECYATLKDCGGRSSCVRCGK